MNVAWILLYTLVTHGLKIVIFFKVDGISLTFERIFKAFLFKILLAVVFGMLGYMVGNVYLSYFMEPLYGIGLSFLLLRELPKKLLLFYGLFPMILVNLFYRGVSYGASSKGEERGVGLYTVMKIVESHPNTSLNTTCQDHVFRQVLTVIHIE